MTASPEVTALLPGSPLNSAQSAFAFCGVYLLREHDESGAERAAVIDTGHVGLVPSVSVTSTLRSASDTKFSVER